MSDKLAKAMVIKIGGATLGSHDTTIDDLVELQQRGKPMVVVHGGGKVITEWLGKQGVPSRFVRGERVTDKAALEVVVSVLAGLVNKEIVASINSRGGRVVGISGVDASLVQGKIKEPELGYVGAVVKVNVALLEVLLQSGYIPVIAPISSLSPDNPDKALLMLNVNADTVAGEIAAAISAERLIFLTDVAGIKDGSGQILPKLSPDEAEALVVSGVASAGMIPKIGACLTAVRGNVVSSIIDGREPHALLNEVEGKGKGTIIIKNKETIQS